ncbi:hypothetical protein J6590_036980 [Homalodisca vitripennis]|nr:hypothetical protein J6590_036980 [Homalodisca vitripennis]
MMSVETVCRVMTCCMVHKALVNQEPQYFSEKLSFWDEVSQRRTRHGNLLHFPKVRLELGRRSFSYFGPKLYNALPPNVAETVSNAVADNIHYAADNISSAVASAYTAFRQKTVEMQESLEEFGSRSRLKKRSLSSLAESSEPEPDSPRPPRSPLDLDPNLITRSGSSSSTEELSSPSHSHSVDQASTRDSLSLTSQLVDDNSDDDEKILFDALQ